MIEYIQLKIATANWSVLPDPIWALIASPLLKWALGCDGPWFKYPIRESRK